MSKANTVEIVTPHGKETIIDLTSDSVTPEKLMEGETAHDKSGNQIVGTFAFQTEEWELTVENDDGSTSTVTKAVCIL